MDSFFKDLFLTSLILNRVLSKPGYESSFTERHRVSAPGTSFFTLSAARHWGWAFCIGSMIAHHRYEMRLLFDDESINYIRNCSFYVEPVDNCTQPKYVPVSEKPKNVTKKPIGKFEITPVISWPPEFRLSLQVELITNTPSTTSR